MKALIDGDPLVWAVGCVVKDDPVENALHTIKLKLGDILSNTGCTEWQIYLSGDTNDRKEEYPSYKSNRKQEKPEHYNAIREYMVDYWGAEIVDCIEADDALGCAADDNCIIVSIDKDLDQIPGRHYNYNKDKLYDVTYDEGIAFFWKQMLMGDSADGIPGIKGVGPKTAENLLDGLREHEMRCMVGLQYAIHFDDPEAEYIKNSKLLWILR